jgi:hypothetical protein
MKRKDYKEVSPEPKDYGGSDYSDDRSPSSWAAAGRDDNDLYIWDEVPKEKTPEGPNGGGNDGGGDNGGGNDGGDNNDGGDTVATTVETMAMTTPSDCIRCVVELAVNPSGTSTRRSTNVSKPWR